LSVSILIGDCRDVLRTLPEGHFNACVTSPPYLGLRNYDMDGQIGLERTPDAFVKELVSVFREVRRVLRDDGLLWLNLGDSYAGSWGAQGKRETAGELGRNSIRNHPKRAGNTGSIRQEGLKPKDLIGVPWRVAMALQGDGWWLRSAIVWAKPNGMPGSQEARCTSSYEMVFMLSKSATYWSDFDAIKTPPRESTLVRTAQDLQAQAGSHRANGGAKTNGPMKAVGGNADKQRGHGRQHAGFNERWDKMERAEKMAKPCTMRDVWFIAPACSSVPHFAQMPEELARRCILAGSPVGGSVLDPFGGAGTTAVVADRIGRDATLIELNPAYPDFAQARLHDDAGLFAEVVLGDGAGAPLRTTKADSGTNQND
jgi:DNA modification methylase